MDPLLSHQGVPLEGFPASLGRFCLRVCS
jgi:hypothetical protein